MLCLEPSSHASCPTHLEFHSCFLPLSVPNVSHMVGIKEEERQEGDKGREHKERGRGGGWEEGGKGEERESMEVTKGKNSPGSETWYLA